MSHDSHHEEHHQEGPEIDITKSKPAFTASFWFMLILAGLFIAALNFINVMSQPEEGHGGGHDTHTEATHEGGHGSHDAKAADHATMEGGHADAVHEPTNEGDQKHEDAAESSSEHH